jgi:hypothetical protein
MLISVQAAFFTRTDQRDGQIGQNRVYAGMVHAPFASRA